MALKLVDGKETRVPGGAIPEGQRRQGALGKLDGMSLSEFRKMPPFDRHSLLCEAYADCPVSPRSAAKAQEHYHILAKQLHELFMIAGKKGVI